jgi:hypothetical protein
MSEPTMTFRASVTRRYNLGDYQHVEGTAEVAGPVPAGRTPEEAIAEAQAMLVRRLAKDVLMSRPVPAAEAPPSTQAAAASAAPPAAPAPAPSVTPAAPAADLRVRLKAALVANPQLIPVMQSFLHERGARGLQSAPESLLPELARVMGVEVS